MLENKDAGEEKTWLQGAWWIIVKFAICGMGAGRMLPRAQRLNSFIMGVWKQVAEYLYIKKKDPNEPNDGWIKYMHGINRISILMFLAGIILMIVRLFFKKH